MNRYRLILNSDWDGVERSASLKSERPLTKKEVESECIQLLNENYEFRHDLIEGEYAPEPEVPEPDLLAAARDVLKGFYGTVSLARRVLHRDKTSGPAAELREIAICEALANLADALEAGGE